MPKIPVRQEIAVLSLDTTASRWPNLNFVVSEIEGTPLFKTPAMVEEDLIRGEADLKEGDLVYHADLIYPCVQTTILRDSQGNLYGQSGKNLVFLKHVDHPRRGSLWVTLGAANIRGVAKLETIP